MASTKKHELVKKEKDDLRQQITEIQNQIATLKTVPSNVLRGSHQEAVQWKESLCSLRANHFSVAPPGARCTLKGRSICKANQRHLSMPTTSIFLGCRKTKEALPQLSRCFASHR